MYNDQLAYKVVIWEFIFHTNVRTIMKQEALLMGTSVSLMSLLEPSKGLFKTEIWNDFVCEMFHL